MIKFFHEVFTNSTKKSISVQSSQSIFFKVSLSAL